MRRREALGLVALPGLAAPAWKPDVLSEPQNRTVETLAELILPRTDTPGARDAQVNRYIDRMLKEGLDSAGRQAFLEGLAALDEQCAKRFGHAFVELAESRQVALLEEMSAARHPFFQQMKNLTLRGYYTSREGLLQELQYQGNRAYENYPGCTHPEHLK
ncbi:MAG: gluconate 2-dehydrogenase subunit 3 family protein [Acidobacteria bacterium]|nr:gluconate 2-dehydrogenase subunit 3 family protein [Acidobacteriota bacterium]